VPSPAGQEHADAAQTAHLVHAAAGGDPHAWQALVDRYSGGLRVIARSHRLSGADTEDVVQTTWLRFVEHLPRITSPASVRAWLATTARRECLRVLREGARCPPSAELPDPPLQREAPAIDARLLESERDEALWRAVGRLAPRDQALVGLLIADPPLSYEQIGAAMDMPTGSIGPTRARCLSRLRRETGRVGLVA
jgi:RNA polymerase sigma factor (sigma-70 family)